MRDFSWTYFSMTGDVDAYLLYKEISERRPEAFDEDEDSEEDWPDNP